jgi:hypothetical protein
MRENGRQTYIWEKERQENIYKGEPQTDKYIWERMAGRQNNRRQKQADICTLYIRYRRENGRQTCRREKGRQTYFQERESKVDILLGAHKLRARRTVCKSVFFSKI